MAEQALGWCPLGLGLVLEDEPYAQCKVSYRIFIWGWGVGGHPSYTEGGMGMRGRYAPPAQSVATIIHSKLRK